MKKIIFMGTPTFAVPILQALIDENYEIVTVVTQPDRPKGRKRILTPSPIKEVALKHNIPVFQPENLRNSYDELLKREIDLIVTAAYGQLLPNELLEHPEFGSINVHASILPELRGGAPIHHAIIQGKSETGISIMYMVDRLDAGDIISQRKIEIGSTDDVGILHDKLAELGASLLIDTLPKIINRTNNRIPQEETKATFAYNVTRSDEKINWSKSHEAVYNQIRGLHPWPGAYTKHRNKILKVWSAKIGGDIYEQGEPGTIVAIEDKKYIIVVCGNGQAVKLSSIQVSGKRRMSVQDYLLGNPEAWQVGEKLE